MERVAAEVAREEGGGKQAERQTHPAAELFPLLTGHDFDQLVADIKEHGVRELGWLDREGRILGCE